MPNAKTKKDAKKESAFLIFPPFLYLGHCSAPSSPAFLTSHGITHILSIGSTPTTRVPGIQYERLPLTDSPTSSISRTSDAANIFIDTAKTKGGKVLVHCSTAISRSPTIVGAYLMKKQGMTLTQALGKLVKARPTTSPNAGFLAQLKEMEMELFGVATLEVEKLRRRREDREAPFADESHREEPLP